MSDTSALPTRPLDSVILIGMPGAGKSTLGVQLAKALAKDFIDTDLLIQTKHGSTLDHILRTQGYLALRALEESVLLQTDYPNHVIATGGSAVYSEAAVNHLRRYGPLIYLKVSEEELLERIHDMETRGIASAPDQTFHDIYTERAALYEQYADLTIECDGKSQQDLVIELLMWISDPFMTQDA